MYLFASTLILKFLHKTLQSKKKQELQKQLQEKKISRKEKTTIKQNGHIKFLILKAELA